MKVVKEGILVFLQGLAFPQSVSCISFIMWRNVPSVSNLFTIFHEGMLNVIKKVFCIYWDDLCFLFLILLMWYIRFIDLHILKLPCTSGMNPTWSWWMTFLMCCWIQFVNILLRIFASVFIKDIDL
jgi:hypothetical protein